MGGFLLLPNSLPHPSPTSPLPRSTRLFALALSFISLFVIACLIQKCSVRCRPAQFRRSVRFANRILAVYSALKGVLIVTLLIMLASKPTCPIPKNGNSPIPYRFRIAFEAVLNHTDNARIPRRRLIRIRGVSDSIPDLCRPKRLFLDTPRQTKRTCLTLHKYCQQFGQKPPFAL